MSLLFVNILIITFNHVHADAICTVHSNSDSEYKLLSMDSALTHIIQLMSAIFIFSNAVKLTVTAVITHRLQTKYIRLAQK